MAAEWWAPPGKLRVRLAACGHTILKRDCPTPYLQGGSMKIACPRCGSVQSPTNGRDGVPSASLTWGEATCRTRHDFTVQDSTQGHVIDVQGLLQAVSAPGGAPIRLAHRELQLGRALQGRGPADGLVLRARPAGRTVTGGLLKLPRATVLLLTGGGVHFQRTHFAGGVLVCCGDSFVGTFQDCTFSECPLYAVHGASATLRRSTLSGGSPAAVAHGPGTALRLELCVLQHCVSDTVAEHGATVAAMQCRSSGCLHSLIARHPGTSLTYVECAISGIKGGSGVQVQGCRAHLRGCTIGTFEHGIIADGPQAAVEVHSSDVSAGMDSVTVREGAAVMLRQTRLSIGRAGRASPAPQGSPAVAWLVSMEGSEMGTAGGAIQVERCTLHAPERNELAVTARWQASVAMAHCDVSCGGNAVTVCERGRVATLSHCAVQSTQRTACLVEASPSAIRVQGGSLSGGQCAGVAAKGGALLVRDALASGLLGGASLCVVTARFGGTATLVRCTLRNAQRGALVARGKVYATDVTVCDLVDAAGEPSDSNCTIGFLHLGGTLSVVGGSVTDCAFATRVESDGGESEPDGRAVGSTAFEGVTFKRNGIAVRVCDRANCVVTAANCTFRGGGADPTAEAVIAPGFHEQMAWVVTRSAQRVSIENSTFSGHQRDVVFYGAKHSLEVRGCQFHGGIGSGPNVLLIGTGAVLNCGFEGALGGVAVKGDARRVHAAVVKGCVFEDAVTEGVSVCDGAHAAVAECRFDGCGKAVVALSRSRVQITDTECTGAGTALSVIGAASVVAQRLTISGGDVPVEVRTGRAARTSVKLMDCVATGAAEGALRVMSVGAVLTVKRCRLEGGMEGVSVVDGASLRVSDTHITSCQVGVLVGMPDEEVREACAVCGRAGRAAMADAWRALRAAADTGAAGARCVHEGAYADAVLQDVVVEQCITGVVVHAAGRVTARGVDVRGALGAYTLTRLADVNVFDGCYASGGTPLEQVCTRRMLGPGQAFETVEEDGVPGVETRSGPESRMAESMTRMFRDAGMTTR